MEVKSYINGKYISTNKKVEVIGPENNKVGIFDSIEKENVALAFQAAKNSQISWSKLSKETRIEYVSKMANKLDEYKEDIAIIMVEEIAKTYNDSLKEVVRTIELFNDAIKIYKNIKNEIVSFDNKKVFIEKKALGVVSLIAPFNYPINLAGSKIAPALLTGNSIVFKCATNGTITASYFARIADEIGIPKGVFNFITAAGKELGDSMYSNKNINGIYFTGSIKTGLDISKKSSMSNVVLELGGNCPAIIMKDANLERASSQIISGGFSFSGQRCTAIKRVYVHDSIKEEFEKLLILKIKKLTVGSARDNCNITPVINKRSRDYILSLVDDAISKGAQLPFKKQIKNNLIYPLLITNATKDMDIVNKEQFGPVLPIISFNSIDNVINEINESQYGLQASIFTKDTNNIEIFKNIETGSINFNGSPQRSPDTLPFLGVKSSGIGEQGIEKSIFSMMRSFNIVINK